MPALEGAAETVEVRSDLGRVADAYESKYGPHFTAPDGTWSGLGDAIRHAEIPLYRVVPSGGLRVRQGRDVQSDALGIFLGLRVRRSSG